MIRETDCSRIFFPCDMIQDRRSARERQTAWSQGEKNLSDDDMRESRRSSQEYFLILIYATADIISCIISDDRSKGAGVQADQTGRSGEAESGSVNFALRA